MRPTAQTLRGAYFIIKTKGVVKHDALRSFIMYVLPSNSGNFDTYLIFISRTCSTKWFYHQFQSSSKCQFV